MKKEFANVLTVFLLTWGFAFSLIHCTGAQIGTGAILRLSKEECQSRALDIVAQDKTCSMIQVELDALAWKAPECVVILQGDTFGEFCIQPDGGVE